MCSSDLFPSHDKGAAEPTPPNGLATDVVDDEAIKELGRRLAKDIIVRFSNKEQWQISK